MPTRPDEYSGCLFADGYDGYVDDSIESFRSQIKRVDRLLKGDDRPGVSGTVKYDFKVSRNGASESLFRILCSRFQGLM